MCGGICFFRLIFSVMWVFRVLCSSICVCMDKVLCVIGFFGSIVVD